MSCLPLQLARSWPPDSWRDCHVVVALSGGADSVALTRALVDLHQQTPGPGKLVLAHYNHRMRGEQSDQDEQWVHRLAENLGLTIAVGRAESANNIASEEQARDARHQFLKQVAQEHGARFVATAHSADDQVETVLMRVLRGSGIDGLSGIPPLRKLSPSVTLVRPLLEVRRTEIEQYLSHLGQSYRTDATNFEPHFTRNWIRGELLPTLRERLASNPDGAVLRLAQQANEWRCAIEQIATSLADQAMATPIRDSADGLNCELSVDIAMLSGHPPIVVQQVFRQIWRSASWPEQAMGMASWQRLASVIAEGDTAGFTLPGNVAVRCDGANLVLARH